jgi:Flp pilus assembly protein TadD
MPNPRLDAFRAMVEKNPRNALARFGLASEALKDGLYEEAVEHLREYLTMYEDEGNAHGRLAEALVRLGRREEAMAALRTGIETARRHGHPGMAGDFAARLEEMEEEG